MSRFYQVKPGDTLTSIAFRFYGNGSESLRIFGANPIVTNPAILNPKWVLIIPDLPTDPVEPSAPLVGGEKDETSIVIDGNQFYLWDQTTINTSIDTIDSFQFSLPYNSQDKNIRDIFKPYQYKKASVSIGGEKVITGSAIKIDTNKNSESSVITISGYASPGILADVNPAINSYPLEYKDNNLEQIAKKLCDPYSIKPVFDADKGSAFKKVTISPTDKILDVLIRLAQQRGLIVTSNPNGDLVFQQSASGKAVTTLYEGVFPCTGCNTSFDGQKRFSSITAIGDQFFGKENGSVVAQDNTIQIARHNVFNSNHITKGELQKAANAKVGRSIATSAQIRVVLTGWRDTDGNLWQKNTRVILYSPDNYIEQETEFLIRDIAFSRVADSLTCTMTLVFPEVFTGEIRSNYPWD